MNKVKVSIVLVLAVVTAILVILSLNNASQSNQPQTESNISGTYETKSGLSLADIALHSSIQDCWTVIGSKVYDITKYIPIHPGGPIIVQACGKNGTELFSTKGGKGREHSDFAKSLLQKYFVGNLGDAKERSADVASESVVATLGLNKTLQNQTSTINANATNKTNTPFTLEEVSLHNKQSDCWIIINGNAYDVTDYIPMHPGGISMITRNCGKDATADFDTKGGSGNTHSNFAKGLLKNYLLGEVSGVEDLPPIAKIIGPDPVLDAGTTETILKVSTDKNSNCKWDLRDRSYASMVHFFDNTGKKSHSSTITGLADGTSYTYYVRCADLNGTSMTASVKITFSVKIAVTSNLTLAEVSNHDTQSDCWIIINGNVYDVTNYIPIHPGGVSMITRNCGKESTSEFNTKGGTGGSHSSSARNLLANYILGPLVDQVNLPPVASITAPGNGQQLADGTTQTTLRATTDKAATCKYDTTDKTYSSMINTFTTTGGTTHTTTLAGLANGQSYTMYVRCDSQGTSMTSSISVTFSVKNPVQQNNSSGITMAQLAAHNTQSSCWLLINSKVYDVTNYIPIHPGGVSMITNNCGKESTNVFNTRGGSGSHSSNARSLLNNYYIGDIAFSGSNSSSNTSNMTTKTVTVTSSGTLNPQSLTINKGDAVTFSYTNPGDEIILTFSPQPPSSMKLDHEYTQKSYTFTTAGTYIYGKSGGMQGTIIVQG